MGWQGVLGLASGVGGVANRTQSMPASVGRTVAQEGKEGRSTHPYGLGRHDLEGDEGHEKYDDEAHEKYEGDFGLRHGF